MPELKRNFSAAKMNKDLDERLIPPGQYRDALNVQIATSDGSNVGSLQTLLGNTIKNTMASTYDSPNSTSANAFYGVPTTAACVGSIALPDKDKIYYMVAGGLDVSSTTTVSNGKPASLDIKKDYILEYDTVTKTLKYVFVDIYQVKEQISVASNQFQNFIYIPNLSSATINKTGVRIGMTVQGTLGSTSYTESDGITVSDIQYDSSNTAYKIILQKDGESFKPTTGAAVNDEVTFKAPRVLNFYYNNLITGLNVVDDMLFWTDNATEPKKINITRSKAGTGGVEYLVGGGILGKSLGTPTDGIFDGDTPYFHTRLVTDPDNDGNLQIATDITGKEAVYVKESHLTVIRKAPTQPLELDMSRTANDRKTTAGATNPAFTTINSFSFTKTVNGATSLFEPGDEIDLTFNVGMDFRVGDILLFVSDDDLVGTPSNFQKPQARGVVVESKVTNADTLFTDGFTIRLTSIDQSLPATGTSSAFPAGDLETFHVRRENKEVLFEFKFVRFSYRYKYADGEYSSFAPFSQIAFLPDQYEFQPKKGYNLGMRNQLRGLTLKQYYPKIGILPEDVVEIDLLYKETNNPTVYVVKTIKPTDGHPLWPDNVQYSTSRGEFEMTTDMVHTIVPSNQLLRPYDNVPRLALAQEITANRLVYGNYLQNYTVQKDPIIQLALIRNPKINVSGLYGVPSVKSIRTYQMGVVFSDDYGRETPVLTNKNASITVPKAASITRNRILAKLGLETQVPSWAKYYSWYVKETTPEYYTMAMDRWYESSDGNIWLSFPSSERNKVDEETFLILKKQHGTDVAVVEKARYKILAIENEAPDHIKTEKKSLGVLQNSNNNLIGNAQEGFPLPDHTFVTVDGNAFNTIFGEDIIINKPDKMVMVIRGSGATSAEYEVSHISGKATSGNKVKLKVKGKFGDDMDFTSTNSSFNTAVSNLTLELLEFEVENRPEFDGRFFVKIYRDELLTKHVLLDTSDDAEYQVVDSEKIYYLNNNYNDQDLNNGTQALGWGSFQKLDANMPTVNSTDHPTQKTHHTVHTWGGSDNEKWGITKTAMSSASVKNLNGINGVADAEFFWQQLQKQKNFFIDASSAYSLDGKLIPGQYEIPGTSADQSYATGAVADDKADGAPNDDISNFKVYTAGAPAQLPTGATTAENSTGDSLISLAQPSRGIWNGGKYMDIAWVGFGDGFEENGGWSDRPYTHKLDNADPNNTRLTAAKTFISQLRTPGTKFRFERDPDETIYTVESFNYNTLHPDQLAPYEDYPEINGAWGIRNFKTSSALGINKAEKRQFLEHNMRQRWTIKVTPPIGSGISGYCPTKGTNDNLDDSSNTRTALQHDFNGFDVIKILLPFTAVEAGKDTFSDNPAVWETEPKESVDLDIYYEASGKIPLELNALTNEEYLPAGTTFKASDGTKTNEYEITEWTTDDTIKFKPNLTNGTSFTTDQDIFFTKRGSYSLSALHNGSFSSAGAVNTLKLHGTSSTNINSKKMYRRYQVLDWSNCYCFGNGVESDRIRDDFNAPQVDNGVKASTTLGDPIQEERRKHGLIYSGIYNSQSGVNNTNQFIQAEKITKDLNPVYGSIQKLHARNTNLITLCEDKVLNILSNKDALFNADGNSNVTATAKVLGSATPYSGNYGISTNPESFAATPYQVFFADQMRGMVLMLAGNAITPISDLGMKDYFSDNLKTYVDKVIGSYDAKKHEYNLTIAERFSESQVIPTFTTLSYSEKSKGWTSFKSFHPENGVSLNNDFYTFKAGQLYIHHNNTTRNNFYGVQYDSDVTLVFNDKPTMVKSFNTVNYEGTQARVTVPATTSISDAAGNTVTSTAIKHNEYFNLTAKNGWYVDSIETNKQTGGVVEFKEKEGKWFGSVCGDTTTVTNLDEKEFSVQGLGTATFTHSSPVSATDPAQGSVTITIANNTSTSYVGDDGSGSVWDATAD